MKDRQAMMLNREAMLARVEQAKLSQPPIWTIYDHPLDVPSAIVVRCWYGQVAHPDAFLTQSLHAARSWCIEQGGCVCLARNQLDDPKVIESWI